MPTEDTKHTKDTEDTKGIFSTMPQAPHIIQIVVTLMGLGMVILMVWELWTNRPPNA